MVEAIVTVFVRIGPAAIWPGWTAPLGRQRRRLRRRWRRRRRLSSAVKNYHGHILEFVFHFELTIGQRAAKLEMSSKLLWNLDDRRSGRLQLARSLSPGQCTSFSVSDENAEQSMVRPTLVGSRPIQCTVGSQLRS